MPVGAQAAYAGLICRHVNRRQQACGQQRCRIQPSRMQSAEPFWVATRPDLKRNSSGDVPIAPDGRTDRAVANEAIARAPKTAIAMSGRLVHLTVTLQFMKPHHVVSRTGSGIVMQQ